MTARKCDISIVGEQSDVVLRLAGHEDQEALREWKNKNRQYFFHQELIRPDQQRAWFGRYLLREHDFMFVVQKAGQPIGCMGIRMLDDGWDVYNVLRGAVESAGDRSMSIGFRMMLEFANQIERRQIGLKVLKQNPAISWYEKNGFSIVDDGEGYWVMRYHHSKVERIELRVHG